MAINIRDHLQGALIEVQEATLDALMAELELEGDLPPLRGGKPSSYEGLDRLRRDVLVTMFLRYQWAREGQKSFSVDDYRDIAATIMAEDRAEWWRKHLGLDEARFLANGEAAAFLHRNRQYEIKLHLGAMKRFAGKDRAEAEMLFNIMRRR